MSLDPITRKEKFLAKAGGQDVITPTPITREEMFLSEISDDGGGGGVVQADYGVNDPAAAGFIKNRPCYVGEETITWDGSTEGRETAPFGTFTLVKISDFVPTASGLVGKTLTMIVDGTPQSEVIAADWIIEGENCREVIVVGEDFALPFVFVADKAGEVSIGNDTYTFPSAGTYFVVEIAAQIAFTEMSITVGVVHKLAAKYLPDDYINSLIEAKLKALGLI